MSQNRFQNLARHFRPYSLFIAIFILTALIACQVILTQAHGEDHIVLRSGSVSANSANTDMSGMDMSTPTVDPNAPDVALTGYVSAIHGTHQNGGPMEMTVFVVDESGNATNLNMDFFAARKLYGKKVKINGKLIRKNRIKAADRDAVQVSAYQAIGAQPSASSVTAQALVSGSRPWVSVLCRFGDETGVTPNPPSYFDRLVSNVYPGINHYWQEMSYGMANIDGSVTKGWYNLPHARSYYFNSDGSFNLDLVAKECTPLAQNDVNFPSFTGINIMLNDSIGCCAWGGGGMYLTLNGQGKSYSMTWMPPWGFQKQQVLAHEMGHGFGLPHSSGPQTYPGFPYNNWWDVMSTGGSDCHVKDATLGCLGTGTNAYHRDSLGWIPTARRFVANVGTVNATVTLERIDQPVSTTNYLMAKIPIANSTTHYYTVEARKQVGYDSALHGEAVIIHEVDTTRSEPAHVVDTNSDGNSNTGDSSAMWTVGKTFTDSANQISVAVIAAPSASSYTITISNGTVPNTPVPTAKPTNTFTPVPTIQPPTNTPIPPTGTNLALNKPTTVINTCASTETGPKAVDGSVTNNSKWCGLVTNGAAWLTVDLGATYSVNNFVVKHAGAGGESTSWNTRDFQIQYSADGSTNWTALVNVTGNTQSITTHNITPQNVRYVRLYITNAGADSATRIYELEVYGNPVSTNVALNKPTTVINTCASTETGPKAVDGSVTNNSKWCGFISSGAAWLTVDLGATYSVNSFIVKHAGAGGESTSWNTKDFQIQYSPNGSTLWTTLVNVTGNTQSITTHNIAPQNVRYVRLYITNAGADTAARIYELEVYGYLSATPSPSTSTPVPTSVPPTFAPPTNTPSVQPTATSPSTVSAWNGNSYPYNIGAMVSYQGHTYKCIQAHTSQPTWDPISAPALWQLIS